MPALSTWVIPQSKKSLVVGVADMVASNDPSAELVTYSLGSCLGVTVYDPFKKAGGLLHLMLPDSTINPDKAAAEPYMFVDTGVPRLFKAVYSLGGDRSRVVVKVAGGAQFFDSQGSFNIGERNCRALQALLARNGHSIHATAVGGASSRTLRLDLSNGLVSISSPGLKPYAL
jgi:chemotaxis protein CheD